MDPLLLIASGSQFYREYSLQAVSRRYPIVLLNDKPNTWQAPYLLDFIQAPLTRRDVVLEEAARLQKRYHFTGVLTYDEAFVEEHAAVAQMLQLPANSVQTARLCRDKHLMRQRWQTCGVPSARSLLVRSQSEAQEAAAGIGYPVVLKPRGLAASVGVIRVDTPENLAAGYQVASIDPHPSYRAAGDGLLVEEYLEGREVSVESAVLDGQLHIVALTRKQVGFAPGFEELGHIVAMHEPLPEDAAIREVVQQAHRALGIQMGVTHAELRLTRQGPRMIELGLRCAGDLIPSVVELATGIDLYAVAAHIAADEQPALQPSRHRAAAIHFLYPPYDALVLSLSVQPVASALPWLERVAFSAHPGSQYRLPPRGFLARMGYIVVSAASVNECQERIDQAQGLVKISLEPLPLAEASAGPQVAPRA
jgi:biotin carboxylase